MGVDLSRHERYAGWFDEIGERVRRVYDRLQEASFDPAADGESFRLPSEEDVQPLLDKTKPSIGFPGRIPQAAGARS